MDNDTIPLSKEDLDFVKGILDSGVNFYRAYDRILTYLEDGSERYFWFQQAAIINRQATGTIPAATNNLSSTYIIAHTALGLALDGINQDIGATSNLIASNVLADVFEKGGIVPLQTILNNDVRVAIDKGHQTVGGWGGSFYYWDMNLGSSTVGAQILAGGASSLMTGAVVTADGGYGCW
jgi:hypothetical protein